MVCSSTVARLDEDIAGALTLPVQERCVSPCTREVRLFDFYFHLLQQAQGPRFIPPLSKNLSQFLIGMYHEKGDYCIIS